MAAGMGGSIAAARILGTSRFGELGITRSTMTTFTLLAGANLGVATARAVSALRENDKERAGRVIGLLFRVCLILSIAVSALAVLLAAPLATHLGAPHLTGALALSAVFIVLASTNAVQIGTLNGFEDFRSSGRLVALEGVLIALLMTVGARLFGVTGAIAGMIVAGGIAFVTKSRAIARICRRDGLVIRHRGLSDEMPLVRTLVLPTLLLGASAQPFAWLARALLARSPNGMVELAIFSAAFPWGTAALTIPSQIARPAMPILSNLLANGDHAQFRRVVRDTLLASLAAAAMVGLPVIALAPWILKAYGNGFGGGRATLILLTVSSVAGALTGALRSASIANGGLRAQAVQSVLWGVVLVGSFAVLRDRGAFGLALAYVAAYVVVLAIQLALAARSELTGEDADLAPIPS